MVTWTEWLGINWTNIGVPLFVFLGAFFVFLQLRRLAYDTLGRRLSEREPELVDTIVVVTRNSLLYCSLVLAAYIALQVSVLEPQWKSLGAKILGTILVVYIGWILVQLTRRLLRFYLGRIKAPDGAVGGAATAAQVVVMILGILLLLDIWGAPMTPILIAVAAALAIAVLVFHDLFPTLFSGFQIAQQKEIKVGDLIKLESGEEGRVEEITWRNTRIRALDNSVVIIPNLRLLQTTVVNYGRQPKVATEPFRFSTRLHLKELTGQKAKTLSELVSKLKEVPDSVIYYHTHNFVEEYQFLTPQPSNDFALWVEEALGYDTLAERLASIDTFEFVTIEALRQRIIAVIQDFLAESCDERQAPPGNEFHFIKSISVVLPTPYVARDLREFVSVLRRISINSLYFHIFEARLRLQRGTNDFSLWLEDCLGEKELAEEISFLDPYSYTLEGLRELIIRLCEKRL